MKSVKDVSVCTVYLLWRTTGPIAQAVAHLAESWGLEVRCARDFRAVTAEAAEFQPHLIILDIALPCFDGYHWCRELRKQTSAPILFLSSAGDNMNVIMAMNFGADDFIAKPLTAVF